MKTIPLPAETFVLHRQRLTSRLPAGALAILNSNDVLPTNADGTMGFHQNADLFHLSGINQEESVLLLFPTAFDDKQREILFLREPNEHLRIWEGYKLSRDQARERSGITQVKWLSELPGVLHRLICEAESVWLNTNEHLSASLDVPSRDLRFIHDLRQRYPLHRFERLAPLMHQLRAVKTPGEIEVIRQACAITRDGFLRTLDVIQPGVNEAEIEAELAHEFISRKAVFAYPPIICSGENNCILHYNSNDQECRDGELVLMDVAAGYGQYMSDLTRTVPVSGRFTARQKDVYRAVLRTFRATAKAMRPGIYLQELRKLSQDLIEAELIGLGLLSQEEVAAQDPEAPLFKKYYMHGVAHHLGLDVHDVGLNSQPLQPGNILTCEPAIYIAEEKFGIRLENDILVTEGDPIDLMADIPIEPEEIERLMRGGG